MLFIHGARSLYCRLAGCARCGCHLLPKLPDASSSAFPLVPRKATRLERGLEKIDDGLYWLLGGAQPTPHAHLASRPVIDLFRCALKLTLVISRKMPIHTRISVAFADIVPATDFHTPLQFYGVQRQGFGPLLHTVSQQVGFSNFC